MQITAVDEVLAAVGLGPPVLNALVPNKDNYTVLLIQPCGQIEAGAGGVRNRDCALAQKQFGAFLSDARDAQADLAVTPEYSMPWATLVGAIKAAGPAPDKLWALGCESIKYGELQALKHDLAAFATVLFEPLQPDPARFVDPLVYVFSAVPLGGDGAAPRTVVLVQFKTHPMGGKDHFEINGMQPGTRIYRFGSAGHPVRLISLICSDAFAFEDEDAKAVYDRSLIVHIQLNPSPRQDLFRFYRDRLFLQFKSDETELICLNWARDVREWNGGKEKPWNNISASAWYLRPKEFDESDATLCANHKRGLYYTWMKTRHTHALFFNYKPATYQLVSTKVAHLAVPAPVSRRVGPKLVKTRTWGEATGVWIEQVEADDGFLAVVAEAGGAADDIRSVYDKNPISGERVLALCGGDIEHSDDWHSVRQLDSCIIDTSEVIRRMTFCQDTDAGGRKFRVKRLKRCGHLWDILKTKSLLPVALKDFEDGFRFEWVPEFPHQNAITEKRGRATVIYMGEECNETQVETVAKSIAELLRRRFGDPHERRAAVQRLAVYFRDGDKTVPLDPHRYVRFDQTSDDSEFYIGRES